MQATQFVMAHGVEQDRLRAILPEGAASLRPVLRINGEKKAFSNSGQLWKETGKGGWRLAQRRQLFQRAV